MKSSVEFANVLEREFGAGSVSVRSSPWTGGAPAAHVAPGEEAALPEILRWASTERVGVVPAGGGTEARCGEPGEAAPLVLDMTRCSRIVDHQIEDLVFTAEAGVTLDSAKKAAAAAGHDVPLSAPFPARATLGGIVAAGADGPAAASYGRTRDQVLGLSVAHADGRWTRAGGRVVKNVTGYDLVRLCTGSRGSLGVIARLTLRLRPVEPFRGGVRAVFADWTRAAEAARRIRDEHPTVFSLHIGVLPPWSALCAGGRVALAAGIRGEEEYGAAMGSEVAGGLAGAMDVEAGCSDPLADLEAAEPDLEGGLRLRALPGDGPVLLAASLEGRPPESPWVFDALAGRLLLSPDPSRSAGEEEAALAGRLGDLDFRADRPADPRFHRRVEQLFPRSVPAGRALMRAVAAALDPAGVLMPGRADF